MKNTTCKNNKLSFPNTTLALLKRLGTQLGSYRSLYYWVKHKILENFAKVWHRVLYKGNNMHCIYRWQDEWTFSNSGLICFRTDLTCSSVLSYFSAQAHFDRLILLSWRLLGLCKRSAWQNLVISKKQMKSELLTRTTCISSCLAK